MPAPPGFPGAATEAAAPDPALDPRRDPFAASQPTAAPTGVYGYSPPPGFDDGKPAEQIAKPTPWGRIGVAVLAVSALFGLGYSCGGIKWARGNMNRTIDQAADIRVEVEKMAKTLSTINARILESPEAAKNSPDVQLAADLGSLDLKKPTTDKIFKTNYYFLDDLTIDRLFNYYNDTIILYAMMTAHAKKTENDKDAIESFVKSGAGKGDKNFGVTLDLSGAIPLAHFAEIGSPICPTPDDVNCAAAELKGFKYRTDPGGAWFEKPIKGPPANIIIPLQKTPLFATAVSGSPDLLAAKDHVRRLAEIRALTSRLFSEQKELLSGLQKAAERHKVNEYFIL